ncbi:hypothetical protein QYM36_006606 [Artemia franciscana]|uniref:SCAN domain-containing protein 3 n=1 Tax=Artemia franciscana TaxID=6661 RepID=A0AA88HZ23_ARTSF|nr:hypothetical protein QYM36_006606 [Artemia franciscana]
MADPIMKQNEIEITNSIALSSSSVSRRIDEMVEDVEKQLIAHLEVKKFALQLDESTSRDNEAILLAYVRFNNEGPQEECFFLEVLRQTQKFYVIAFPTSYLVEAGFSRVSQMLSKDRNRLDIVKRSDLRLLLTSIEPNIKKLVEKHQPQGSH